MGQGAQLLYFHLCMHADDDGVVEAYTVKRGIGANDDDLQNLIGRGFVRMLDEENEIILITDWYEHNKLRRDRITPSVYRNLIERVVPDVPLLEPAQRADRRKQPEIIDVQADDGQMTGNGQPTDGQWTDNGTSHGRTVGRPMDGQRTDNGPHKISKDKLSKAKLSEDKTGEDNNGASAPTNRKRFMRPSIQEIKEYCTEKGYTHVDAEYFWNYYENINWHVGKNKMKSWKLAVANWEKRQIEFERQKGAAANQQTGLFMQHTDEEKKDTWGWD